MYVCRHNYSLGWLRKYTTTVFFPVAAVCVSAGGTKTSVFASARRQKTIFFHKGCFLEVFLLFVLLFHSPGSGRRKWPFLGSSAKKLSFQFIPSKTARVQHEPSVRIVARATARSRTKEGRVTERRDYVRESKSKKTHRWTDRQADGASKHTDRQTDKAARHLVHHTGMGLAKHVRKDSFSFSAASFVGLISQKQLCSGPAAPAAAMR